LIFTDSTVPDGVLVTVYNDYNLQPGEEYTYTVIAYNRKGSVESPPSKAQTYATSPSGVEPPTLTPESSTSLKATWRPPSSPNGQIVNYTLYEGNTLTYSGPPTQLTYINPGLSFYTTYTLRLQACTQRGCSLSQPVSARTLEAPPQQLDAPQLTALATETGAHAGVRVTWLPPAKPNGNLLYYQLQRRSVLRTAAGKPSNDINYKYLFF
jgi:usherin